MNSSLKVLQEEWRAKFSEMRREFGELVTGPFLSVEPPGYDPDRIPSVLYVGKAIGPNEQLPEVATEDLRDRTRNFIRQVVLGAHAGRAFWNFALSLSAAVAKRTGHSEISPLQNLVWTNICKIGDAKKNPERGIYERQKDLAVATLKAELMAYRPTLVFWVTGEYRFEIVREVINDTSIDDSLWEKDLQNEGIYTKAHTDSLPAMIWTYHPQGKSRKVTERWIECATNLLDRSRSAG